MTYKAVEVKTNTLYPDTAKDALDKWDKGENVFTIEMGGLGPSYEQAIHIGVFEVIRELHNKKLPDSKTQGDLLQKTFDNVMFNNDIIKSLHLSGTQAGAITQVAYKAMTLGWRDMLSTVPNDRRIQVTKSFP